MTSKPETGEPKKEFLGSYLPHLINRVALEMVKGVDEKFAQHGLTVSKWRILAALSDKGTCRFGELADRTSIEPASLSRFIGALSKEGLVRRRRSTADARAVRIALTERGEAVFTATLPWAADAENRLARGLSPAQVDQLKQMLIHIYGNIHDYEFADLDLGLAMETSA